MSTTPHYARIKELMLKIPQDCPGKPTVPSESVRLLRAKLILEEAFETIEALDVNVSIDDTDVTYSMFDFTVGEKPDLVGIVDGCADISVVTIGTLIACGVKDAPILEAVDENNLAKFGPGGHRREDGKWIKPPGHKPPDIKALLLEQSK